MVSLFISDILLSTSRLLFKFDSGQFSFPGALELADYEVKLKVCCWFCCWSYLFVFFVF